MRHHNAVIMYLAAVLVVSLAYIASPISRDGALIFPSLTAMADANPLTTALTLLLASAALAFLAFPFMPMVYMAAGFYMDGLAGAAVVLLGSTLGGLGAFLFYRKHISHHYDAGLEPHSPVKTWLTLLGLRLSPLVPAPLVNFFAAVFFVSPLQYLTTGLLGGAPLVLFYVQIGKQGHQFLSGATPHWQEFSGYAVILTISTLLSALGPWRSLLTKLRRAKYSLDLQPAAGP